MARFDALTDQETQALVNNVEQTMMMVTQGALAATNMKLCGVIITVVVKDPLSDGDYSAYMHAKTNSNHDPGTILAVAALEMQASIADVDRTTEDNR